MILREYIVQVLEEYILRGGSGSRVLLRHCNLLPLCATNAGREKVVQAFGISPTFGLQAKLNLLQTYIQQLTHLCTYFKNIEA